MVLVDTSVWIRFLAGREPFARILDTLLDREEAVGHELVYGELLVGDRRDRADLLTHYDLLVHAPTIPHPEVVAFVRARKLRGRGIGWVDAHLLASVVVASFHLWTADARLDALAHELRVSYGPS